MSARLQQLPKIEQFSMEQFAENRSREDATSAATTFGINYVISMQNACVSFLLDYFH